MPLWTMDEPDVYPEIIPLLSLRNPNVIPETAIIDGTLLARNAANETITGQWLFSNLITSFEAADVQVQVKDTAGAADQKYWRYIATSGALYFQVATDALSWSTAFKLTRSGGTPTSMEVNAPTLRVNSATPIVRLSDAGGGVNAKNWDWTVNTGVMYLQLLDDGGASPVNAIVIPRSGTNIDSVRLQTGAGTLRSIWDSAGTLDHRYGLMLSGYLAISLTGNQTAWVIPTGYFIFYVTPTGSYTIRGITALAGGSLFTVVNLTSSIMTFTHEDGSASSANRLRMPGAASVNISNYESLTFYYDASASRFYVIGWTK